jgi:hypothetical protein
MVKKKKKEITISDLYPGLEADEQLEAEENLLRYLTVVKGIFLQIQKKKPEILTELQRRASLRKESKTHL